MSDVVTDLVVFLNARLAEDEQVARVVRHWRGIRVESATEAEEDHVLHWSPERVLAEVEAKRAMLTFLGQPDMPEGEGKFVAECTLKLLALPYADRAGYQLKWRVDPS